MSDLIAQRDDAFEPDEDALAAALRNQDDIPILMDVVADQVDEEKSEVEEAEVEETAAQETNEEGPKESVVESIEAQGVSQEAYFEKVFGERSKATESNETLMHGDALESVDAELGAIEFGEMVLDDIQPDVVFSEEQDVTKEFSDEQEVATQQGSESSDDSVEDIALVAQEADQTNAKAKEYTEDLVAKAIADVLEKRLPDLIAEVMGALQTAENSKPK